VRKADSLPSSCAVVTKSGNLNFLEPSGPLQACNGTDLPLYFLPVGRDLCAPQNTLGLMMKMNDMCLGQESKPIPCPNNYNDRTKLFNVCQLQGLAGYVVIACPKVCKINVSLISRDNGLGIPISEILK